MSREPKTPAHKPDKPDQRQAFIETARRIGADEESSAADVLMGRLARTPPKPKDRPKLSAKDREAES